jgi:hypothetical protein
MANTILAEALISASKQCRGKKLAIPCETKIDEIEDAMTTAWELASLEMSDKFHKNVVKDLNSVDDNMDEYHAYMEDVKAKAAWLAKQKFCP